MKEVYFYQNTDYMGYGEWRLVESLDELLEHLNSTVDILPGKPKIPMAFKATLLPLDIQPTKITYTKDSFKFIVKEMTHGA